MIELIIILTVTILSASVAIPICAVHERQAKLSEVDAYLGHIRTQLRIYHSQYGEYPKETSATSVVGAFWNDMDQGTLTGKYFADSSYAYVSKTGTDFTLICKAKPTLGFDRVLDESGVLTGGM